MYLQFSTNVARTRGITVYRQFNRVVTVLKVEEELVKYDTVKNGYMSG